MKRIATVAFLIIISLSSFGQNKTIPYYDWSNPSAFKMGPSPKLTGYGYYSDSLSNVYDGTTFYVYDNEYYAIDSWADYYLWYTKKYSHLFTEPALYEYYYSAKDDYNMASYIASDNYKGTYYPANIMIEFTDDKIEKDVKEAKPESTKKDDKKATKPIKNIEGDKTERSREITKVDRLKEDSKIERNREVTKGEKNRAERIERNRRETRVETNRLSSDRSFTKTDKENAIFQSQLKESRNSKDYDERKINNTTTKPVLRHNNSSEKGSEGRHNSQNNTTSRGNR